MKLKITITLGLWLLTIGASIVAAAYEPLKEVVIRTLPALPPRASYPTDLERKKAIEQSQEASRYESGILPGYVRDLNKALILWHDAAQYGYPSACAALANAFQKGLYGLAPDDKRAKEYSDRMNWWKDVVGTVPPPPMVASGGASGGAGASYREAAESPLTHQLLTATDWTISLAVSKKTPFGHAVVFLEGYETDTEKRAMKGESTWLHAISLGEAYWAKEGEKSPVQQTVLKFWNLSSARKRLEGEMPEYERVRTWHITRARGQLVQDLVMGHKRALLKTYDIKAYTSIYFDELLREHEATK